MNDDALCFCGSGLTHKDCHSLVNPESIPAKILRIQAQRGVGSALCSSQCRSRCFLISEAEFVLVLDAMLRHLPKEKIQQVIRQSKAYWRLLQEQCTEIAQKISGEISPDELAALHETALPFPCVLFSGGVCLAQAAKPLHCSDFEGAENFLFLTHVNRIIFRRPAPIFYYFTLIFADENLLESISEIPFFHDLLSKDEDTYIATLVAYENTP